MARKNRVQELDEDDLDEFEHTQAGTKARMVDWLQCCKLPLAFTLIGYLIAHNLIQDISKGTRTLESILPAAGEDVVLAVVGLAFVFLGPLAMLSQILGYSFNEAKNALSYPLYVFRRSVRLSEISDANCQTITKPAFHMTNTIIGLISVGQIRGLGNTKRYFVNLSGDFGARRIVFHTKYKRDQFLGLLRAYAPDCRITRWT